MCVYSVCRNTIFLCALLRMCLIQELPRAHHHDHHHSIITYTLIRISVQHGWVPAHDRRRRLDVVIACLPLLHPSLARHDDWFSLFLHVQQIPDEEGIHSHSACFTKHGERIVIITYTLIGMSVQCDDRSPVQDQGGRLFSTEHLPVRSYRNAQFNVHTCSHACARTQDDAG